VPASRAFGSGIHVAAAYFFRGVARGGGPPTLADVQAHFEALWNLETQAQSLRYGEKETKESLRDLAMKMVGVLHREFDRGTDVLAVEEPFRVPLVDADTGEALDRDLVGTIDLLERDAERRAVVVDVKTSVRKYSEDQASYCNSFRACYTHSGYCRRSR
jgi:RecB family exonuclease